MTPGTLLATAGRMLVHNRWRLVLSCLSIAFSVVIMFMQMGFFNGLNDSQANLARVLDADLVMMSRDKDSLKSSATFNLMRLRQAIAVEGVASGTWLYTDTQYWWNPGDGSRNRVLVIATDPERPGLRLDPGPHGWQSLKRPGTVLYDLHSRPELGDIAPGTAATLGTVRVEVTGLISLGANFTYEGHVVTGYETWNRIFDYRNPETLMNRVSLGLLKLRPGADAGAVRTRLIEQLPDDIIVLTRAGVEARERDYTTRATPVGIIFGIGLVVALAIGIIICYQLLFNEIHDHLPQFATLKAIGYPSVSLYALVICESLLLACIGFVPGLLATAGLYRVIENFSEILMYLTPGRVLFILALTVVMSIASAALAVRQVVAADPAALY